MRTFEVHNPLTDMRSGCLLSECGTFRYKLWRSWDHSLPVCLFVMLNPSTATHTLDDPTIRRCLGFARSWGCGRLEVVNLFAYRATDPRALLKAAYPIGEMNDGLILNAAHDAQIIVAAWGANAPSGRVTAVLKLLAQAKTPVECLGRTNGGQPRHPLYVPAKQPREPLYRVCETVP